MHVHQLCDHGSIGHDPRPFDTILYEKLWSRLYSMDKAVAISACRYFSLAEELLTSLRGGSPDLDSQLSRRWMSFVGNSERIPFDARSPTLTDIQAMTLAQLMEHYNRLSNTLRFSIHADDLRQVTVLVEALRDRAIAAAATVPIFRDNVPGGSDTTARESLRRFR
jgi:hypothetical protein